MGNDDDDYHLFSPREEESSQQSFQERALRRLKKSVRVSTDPTASDPPDEGGSPNPDGAPLASPEGRDCEESNGPRLSGSVDVRFDEEEFGPNSGTNGYNFGNERVEAKMALEFDSEVAEFKMDEIEDLKIGRSLNNGACAEGSEETKKTKKRAKRLKINGHDEPKISRKERRIYLQQLHADSQRLLRETGDATFKPIPVVQKPVSLVLQKIQKRKLELSKTAISLNTSCSSVEKLVSLGGLVRDIDSEVSISSVERHDKTAEAKSDDMLDHVANVKSDLDAPKVDGCNESGACSSNESAPSNNDAGEGSMPPFQVPPNDAQELIYDSRACDANEPSNGTNNNTIEEVFAPSMLAMNSKLDYAPPDEVSDHGQNNDNDNDKDIVSSPTDDPVKAFVDDEAEEEDDRDNDQCFLESEDEENGEAEEFNDLITNEYEEKAVDNQTRNHLHQQWLEQQDAAGTENLLQRLKYGHEQREPTLLKDDDEDLEESNGEDAAETDATDVTKINSRKIKQMIPLMFNDKDEPFSSSDDEETEQRLVKQRVLEEAEQEERATFFSPSVDESSKEVFGLIRKLNVVPDNRKKAKTSSAFATMLTTGKSNSFSKSSFVGRTSNHSLPSSHKQGSSTTRSFIFGRDDSNRSAISSLEESSDKLQMDNRPSRGTSAKYVSPQSKSSSQNTKAKAEGVPGASLFELLRRTSMESTCTWDTMVALPETMFSAFKCTKKTVKMERR